MKKRIFIKHWLQLKPQNYSGKTDFYYLKIANNIYSNLGSHQKTALNYFIDENEIITLCCFLTCYYEDVISQTNIWQSFKELYNKSYKKKLPFYVLDENYIDAEINLEDVAFLLWYYINAIQNEKFANPYNELFFDIAKQVMEILDEDYEFAPENTELKAINTLHSKLDANDEEFYKIREYLHRVFFESYLFYPDVKRRLDLDILDTLATITEEDPNLIMGYAREVTEDFTFNNTSALLALNAKDWAKTVLGRSNPNFNSIATISEKIHGLFLYKAQSDTSVTLEHIASGMLFEITKRSFDSLNDLTEDNILYIGLVKYNGDWWFSGNFIAQPFDANLILDQKNSAEARSEVNFLEDKDHVKSILAKQKEAFLNFNEGSLIAFLRSNELDTFINDYYTFFNESLGLTEKERKNALKRFKAEGYLKKTEGLTGLKGYEDSDDLYVVFFNPASGIEFYDDIINAFPDKRNRFFTKESPEDVQYILMSEVCSTEFTNYFIEQYKDKLKYFKIEPYKSYLNDLDFLLKFWKKDNYHTQSTLVIAGKNE